MKVLKTLSIAIVIALAGLAASSASAGDAYVCQVDFAGPHFGKTCFRLTQLQGPTEFPAGQWFVADPVMEDQMLMVALTAMVKGMKVKVKADLDLLDPDFSMPVIESIMLLR